MEGLRGFAVLLVFLLHYVTAANEWTAIDGPLAAVFGILSTVGHSGVDLFFILSGYLIYGNLIKSGPRFSVFMGRRIKRLYPTFLTVFAIYIFLSYAHGSGGKIPPDGFDALIYLTANLFLLPGLLPIEPLVQVAWSLSYEIFFYITLPAVIAAFSLRSRTRYWRMNFVVAAAVVFVAAAAAFGGHVRLLMFLGGILLFEILAADKKNPLHEGFGFLGLVGVVVVMCVPMPGSVLQTLRMIGLAVGFGVICHLCFSKPAGFAGRLFGMKYVRWLGNMSYSYYLVHGLAIKIFFLILKPLAGSELPPLAPLVLLFPCFLFTLLVSAFLFIWVERPYSLVGKGCVVAPPTTVPGSAPSPARD